jgi:hypothetical protein
MNAMKANMHRLSLFFALMASLLAGCSLEKLKETRERSQNITDAGGTAKRETADLETPKSSSTLPTAEAKAISPESKIIKTAHLEFQVAGMEKSKKQIDELVNAEKGYISNLEEINDRRRIQASYTIRVPAGGFDRLVENMLKQGSYVGNSKIERKDVTEEFLDLKARMETEKIQEASYREVLHQAKSIKDILEVSNELGALREKIEAKEGRMKYLSHQAEYSTIFAIVSQTLPYTRPPESEGEGFISLLKSSLANGWTGLVYFTLGLINIWPVLIIAGVILFLILRRKKRAKQPNRSADKKDSAIPPTL